MISDLAKFIIHENGLDMEPRACIYINDTLKEVAKLGSRAVFWGVFNGDYIYNMQCRDQERN